VNVPDGHQIILVRHGRPAAANATPISGREVGQWVIHYNGLGIDRGCPPPLALSRLVASAGCVMASDLRRARESAEWLCSQTPLRIDSELREAVLPDALPSSLRMHPGVWVVLARIGWWLDWCASEESVDATRQRAGRTADRLCALAREHESIVVVGHGMFNRFVARELVARRWRGPAIMPGAYWSAAPFVPKPTRTIAIETRVGPSISSAPRWFRWRAFQKCCRRAATEVAAG
jgi:broad specificity phosphatase PhoE